MSKLKTQAESQYMNDIADLGCVLCHHLGFGNTPATLHHPREGSGMSQRSSHWLSIPLCKEHHQGATGLHGLGTRGFYSRYKLDEMDLLSMTIQLKETGRLL